MVTTPVSTETGASAAALAQRASSATSRISSDFETFLKMLTVQMENQDPLNPIESSDYAVQLATFSGVEQQVLTNDLLKALATQSTLSGMAQMAGWVGNEARAPVAALFDGSPVTVLPKVAEGADRAEIVVRDAEGTVIERRNLPLDSGSFQWAGTTTDNVPLPNGLYSFTVESFDGDTALPVTQAEVYSEVQEVRMEAGVPTLVLGGGVTIAADKVTGLRGA